MSRLAAPAPAAPAARPATPEPVAAAPDEGPQSALPQCKICMSADVDALLVPCHHALLCEPCAARIQGPAARRRCPVCREPVRSVQRIYLS